MARTLTVLIERDEDGLYVGRILELPGCMSQADTIDELKNNLKEAATLYLEVRREPKQTFVGVEHIEVA